MQEGESLQPSHFGLLGDTGGAHPRLCVCKVIAVPSSSMLLLLEFAETNARASQPSATYQYMGICSINEKDII